MRVNIGCGMTPTEGWINYDNSLTVRVAHIPLLPSLMAKGGLLSAGQRRFAEVARTRIRRADAKRIPLPDESVEVVYSSHMMEHLTPPEAAEFLRESLRVLVPQGVIRLVLPDLRCLVDQYLDDGDADRFMQDSLLTNETPRGILKRLKHALIGERHHQWMYDARSAVALLERHGFVDVKSLRPGETRIAEPGTLDLGERAESSIFIEGNKPLRAQD